jgi:hypothetical protein
MCDHLPKEKGKPRNSEENSSDISVDNETNRTENKHIMTQEENPRENRRRNELKKLNENDKMRRKSQNKVEPRGLRYTVSIFPLWHSPSYYILLMRETYNKSPRFLCWISRAMN